jgi:hypothetical protein
MALLPGLAALDAVWTKRVTALLNFVAAAGCRTRHKLLLSLRARNCYKCGVREIRVEISAQCAKRAKAPTGTTTPASAKADLCTVSVLEEMPATL